VQGNNIYKFLNAYFSFFLNLSLKINDNKIICFHNSPDCTLEISRTFKVIKRNPCSKYPFWPLGVKIAPRYLFWLLSNGIMTKQRNIMPTHVASSCICALGLTFRPNCRCHVWVLSGSTTTSPRCICIFCGSGMYLLIARLVKSSLNKTLLTDWLTGCQDWRRGYGLWCISYGDFGGILEILDIVNKKQRKNITSANS